MMNERRHQTYTFRFNLHHFNFVSYQSVFVRYVVGQLELVEGHGLLHPLLASSRAVRVDVHPFRHLGVGAIIAESFSRIFYRNAINFGLPLLIFPQASQIETGQLLEVNPVEGVITNATIGQTWKVDGIPSHLMEMIDIGGLMPWLKARYANTSSDKKVGQ